VGRLSQCRNDGELTGNTPSSRPQAFKWGGEDIDLRDSRSMRRVGLVGYGLAGRVFHAPLIRHTDGLEVVAVVTSDAGRASQAAHDLPGVRVVDDVETLLASEMDVDVLVVATANNSHVPIARRAIHAGVAVVVDKPLAPDAVSARALVREAEEAGVLLTIFQNRRWDNDFLTVQGLVAAGRLGAVRRFESRFERWSPVVRQGSWREDPLPGSGAGLLFDLGSHLVDQALLLFGPATVVFAELDRRRPGSRVDDDVCVALTHAGGVRSHLWASAVAVRPGPRFRVLGSEAGYVRYGLDPQEQQLKNGMRPGEPGWGEQPPSQDGTLGIGDTLTTVPTTRGAYETFYSALVAALEGFGPVPVDPWDAVRVIESLEAARVAATREFDPPGTSVSDPTSRVWPVG
jgi:predicted dehydrogenase